MKERVTIWGVCSTEVSAAPGMTVPSAEQKQSGSTHSARSHRGALFCNTNPGVILVVINLIKATRWED